MGVRIAELGSSSAFFNQPEVVLCMLVAVFSFDLVAFGGRRSGRRKIVIELAAPAGEIVRLIARNRCRPTPGLSPPETLLF